MGISIETLFQFIEHQKTLLQVEKQRVEQLKSYLSQLDCEDEDDDEEVDDNRSNGCGDGGDEDEINHDDIEYESESKGIRSRLEHDEHIKHDERHLISPKTLISSQPLVNGDSRPIMKAEPKITKRHDHSMFNLKASPLNGIGYNDRKRNLFNEERNREYNEYLREKAKLDEARRRRRVLDSRPNSSNMTSILLGSYNSDYNDLLRRKKAEENRYRELNGIGIDMINKIDLRNEEREITTKSVGQIGNWDHFNGEGVTMFVPDYITPRSRLLASNASRVRAAQYRNELLQQIEEKKLRKAREEERARLEELELERKVEEQRKKMVREFEEEKERLRLKTDEMLKKQEINKVIADNELFPVLPRQDVIRSPSYMQVRATHLRTHPSKARRHLEEKYPKPLLAHQNIPTIQRRVERPKIDIAVTSPSGDSMDEEFDEQMLRNEREHAKRIQDMSNKRETIKEHAYQLPAYNNNIANTKVLGHLTEVRKMVQQDHLRMLERLQQQEDE